MRFIFNILSLLVYCAAVAAAILNRDHLLYRSQYRSLLKDDLIFLQLVIFKKGAMTNGVVQSFPGHTRFRVAIDTGAFG